MKYFSYDPNGNGFEFHDTAEEAKKLVEEALQYEQDNAYDGWSENVDQICWGEIKEQVTCTEEKELTEEEKKDNGHGFDIIAEYKLLPTENTEEYK